MTTATERGPDATRREARLAAWAAIALLVVGLAVAPPWADVGELPEGFAARFLAGDLERETLAGWTEVRADELVAEGTRVRTLGGATLTVSGGLITLAEESVAVLDGSTTVEFGSLLTEVAGSDRTVRIGGVIVTGRGAWRVDAAPNQRIAVYDGALGLRAEDAEEDGLAVRRFEQVGLLAGRFGEGPLPLRYRTDDLWDARLLAAAITVDREVERLERGLAATYGTEPQDADFYTTFQVVDEEDLGSLPASTVDEASPGEVLTHLTVVDLIAQRTEVGFDDAADEVVTLRRAGATWGLMLMRHGLGVEDLRGAVDLTLEGAPAAPPEPEEPEEDASAPEPELGPGPAPAPEQAPAPSPTPTPDEDDEDSGEGTGGLVDELEETVDDVEEDLGDLIDDVTDPLDGVLPRMLP